MTLFLDKMRGIPEDLYGKKVLHLVAQMAYPTVVGFLAEHLGAEGAAQNLRDIGSNICKKFLKVYKPKKKKISPVIKEFFEVLWEDKKIKLKVIEKDKSKRPVRINIIDGNCGLCPKKEELVEIEGLNYCVAVSGFIETLLNELNDRNYPLGIKSAKDTVFRVETLTSRSPENKKCIHQIQIFYKS
ncbi:MAG: hypothetical protein ACTSO9_19725 [Candidatus Helarchaeota archaeon]